MEQQKKRVNFLINIAYFVVIIAIVYVLFKYALGLFLPFVIAFFIASIVRPLVVKINNRFNMRQEVLSLTATILLYIVVIAVLLGIIIGIVVAVQELIEILPDFYTSNIQPTIINVLTNLIDFLGKMPGNWTSATNVLTNLLQLVSGTELTETDSITSLMNTLGGSIPTILSYSQKGISAITSNVPSFFIALVFTIMLSFFIGMQYEQVIGLFKKHLPKSWLSVCYDFKSIVGDSLFRYMKAVFKLMIITGLEMFVGLLILQVKHAFLIAVAIAIFDALPVFGTGAIVIPWIIVELLQGNLKMAIGLTILYIIICTIRSFIEPKIVGEKLGLNPIVSLLATYVGFKLFGVLGMIFMPIVAQILIQLITKRMGGKHNTDAPPLLLPEHTATSLNNNEW